VEVVGAVQDHVGLDGQARKERPGTLGHERDDRHLMVDFAETLRGRNGLGQTGDRVGFAEQDLALQIAPFHDVAVDDQQTTDTGSGERVECMRAKGAATDDQDGRFAQAGLARFADAGNPSLSAVAVRLAQWTPGAGHP
jgi:hypothetical protein